MAEAKESTSVPLSRETEDPEDPAKAPLNSSNSSSTREHSQISNAFCSLNSVICFMEDMESQLETVDDYICQGSWFFSQLGFFFVSLRIWFIKVPLGKKTRRVRFSWKREHVMELIYLTCMLLFPSKLGVQEIYDWMFVDGFFSPMYEQLGIDIFDQNTTAFKEVAIIRHPRVGEYAFGFITSSVVLQTDDGDEELCSVFVPTNHLYIGDVLLVNANDIIRPNLSIREGIDYNSHLNFLLLTTSISNPYYLFSPCHPEIIVSGGMTMPQTISPLERISSRKNDRIPMNRISYRGY
ncbi:hypothetical protein V2J09_002029 [Rumex salicifolius]